MQETSLVLGSLIATTPPSGQAVAATYALSGTRDGCLEAGHLALRPNSGAPVILTQKLQAEIAEAYVIALLPDTSSTRATVIHCGQECRLSERSATLLRSEVPFRIELLGGSMTYAVIAAADLLAQEPRVHTLAGHPLSGMVPAILTDISPTISHEYAPEISARAAVERLALSLTVEIDKRPGGALNNSDLNRRAVDLIASRCHRPDVKALDLATELGVNVRQLESMFKRRGTSTLEQLAIARIALVSQRTDELDTVGLETIAHECGFYDPSHLKRTWAKVTGSVIGTASAAAAAPTERGLIGAVGYVP